MFVALWEYEVKPGCEERFENAYGPSGDWARLFQSDSNYRETGIRAKPTNSSWPPTKTGTRCWTPRGKN